MIRKLIFCMFISLFACNTWDADELDITYGNIQFDVESVSGTRGSIITGATGRNPLTSMSVFCAYTENNKFDPAISIFKWMYNVRVTRTGISDRWIVNDLSQPDANRKWAGVGYHTFFAIAPYQKNGFITSPMKGFPELTYEVPFNHKDQTDLLYSHKILLDGKQMYIGSRPVNFGFSHALSKISFAAKKETGMIENIRINKITMFVQRNKGKLGFNLTGKYPDMVTASWNTLADNPRPNILSIENSGLRNIYINESEYTLLHAVDSALFLLPQVFQFTSGNSLLIDYSLIKQGGSVENKSITVDLARILDIKRWEIGKAYRYAIQIKDEKVVVTGTITDWLEKPVDGNIKATYLSLSESEVNISRGSSKEIYYTTDGTNISVKISQGVNFKHDSKSKKITIENTTLSGKYTLEVRADKITRKVKLTVI